jgi:hypothetical protein
MNLVPMSERKLTISEVVQFNFVASSRRVQSRESANGPAANDDNLLRRHFLEGI